MNMKKFTMILALVMVASFLIAGIIFASEYGRNGFANLEQAIKPANAVDVNEEKTEALNGIKVIKISSSSEDINIIKDEGNEVKAHFYGYYSCSKKDYKPELKVSVSGNELIIEIKHQSISGMISYSSNLKLDVYVPQEYADSMEIHTSSADVTAGAFKLNSLLSKSSSGDLRIASVEASEGDFSTTSGNIDLKGKFDNVKTESSSGDVKLSIDNAIKSIFHTTSGSVQGSVSSKELEISSSSGNISLESVKAEKTAIKATSGTIKLSGNPGEIRANTSSGDVYLKYAEFVSNITANTTAGEVEIKLPSSAEFALDYKTAAGSAKCDFPITISSPDSFKGLKGIVVSDTYRINISTSSGDLRVIK